MQKVSLSDGFYAFVDLRDFPFVSKYSWKVWPNRKTNYARANINGKTVTLHRLLLSPLPGFQVDHINGNGLDNRRSNLRVATSQMNNWNRRFSWKRNPVSRFKGVDKHNGKWRAQATIGGKRCHIGYFKEEIDAASAYDTFVKEKIGIFAYLNFPAPEAQK